ncbi:MAG: hypothetical protein P4L22_02770 [Candidatus Babeliales bacterium]|nr:hypothetical protein [Candidatus Babeliales bacterium]
MKFKILFILFAFNILNASDMRTSQECFYKKISSPKSPAGIAYTYIKNDLLARYLKASNIFAENTENKNYHNSRILLEDIMNNHNPEGLAEIDYKNILYNTRLLLGKIYFIGDSSEKRDYSKAKFYFKQLAYNSIPENIRNIAQSYLAQIKDYEDEMKLSLGGG